MIGMGLAGFTKGLISIPGKDLPPYRRIRSMEEYFSGKLSPDDIKHIKLNCQQKNLPLHDELMKASGWPEIPFDGKLLVTQQDALLLGGKVQAAAGYADHVQFLHPELCKSCGSQICIEMCSGQAITPGDGRVPVFDREKCVHCGACLWNCAEPVTDGSAKTNVVFTAGAGGLHSAEN